jgi:hypothetical protein
MSVSPGILQRQGLLTMSSILGRQGAVRDEIWRTHGPDIVRVEVVKLGLMLIQPNFQPLEPRANLCANLLHNFHKRFQCDRVCGQWLRIPRRVRRGLFLHLSLSSFIPWIAFHHWQVYAALSPVRSRWRMKHW